jgi:hypothetical protein
MFILLVKFCSSYPQHVVQLLYVYVTYVQHADMSYLAATWQYSEIDSYHHQALFCIKNANLSATSSLRKLKTLIFAYSVQFYYTRF